MKKLLIFLSLILLSACSGGDNREMNSELEEIVEVDEIEERIKEMSVDEKIGQLIIAGVEEKEIRDRDRELINKYKIGGFIFFKNNISDIENTRKLIDDLKEENKSDIELFISVDEEGGLVQRMPEEVRRIPSAERVGAKNDVEIAYNYGKIIGMRLKHLGFNLNFGPVLDINSNPDNPVIGSRAFSNDKEIVKNLGGQAIRGMKDEDIKSVIKHFPGHGDTDIDSHMSLPKIDKDLEELYDLELYPFVEAIDSGVDGVMVGHILFPEIDIYPASVSGVFIGDILRNELGYDGLVLSDDMTMGGILENYTLEEASIEFLKSGGDLLLLCHGYDNVVAVHTRIKDSLESGDLKESRIDESVYRILRSKEDLKDNKINNKSLDEINRLTDEFINSL